MQDRMRAAPTKAGEHSAALPFKASWLQSWAGAALLVLFTTLPVLILRTPPMIDVLGHTGRYALQTGLQDDPWLQQFFHFRWQVIGNLGADLIVEALHPLLGFTATVKLALALVPILAGSAILLLSNMIHARVTAFAVLALPLIYALPFTWGFLNFSLAMALALLAFALWLRVGPGTVRALLFVPIGLAVWLCHTFGWAFLGILCTGETLARQWSARRSLQSVVVNTIRDEWPLLAPLLPMLLWRSGATGSGIDGWFDIAQKVSWLLSMQRFNFHQFDILCALSLVLAAVAGFVLPQVLVDRRLGWGAAIALAAFLLLPGQVFGSVFADMRLAPYVLIVALLSLRENVSHTARRVLMGMALAYLVLRLVITGSVYREREAELERHLAALSAVPEHARLATLVELPCHKEWALPWFSHIGSMALVRRHAFVNDQWANSAMNPLTVSYAVAGPFATDDRQLFYPQRCGMTPTLPQAIAALPLKAFSHVWVIGPDPAAIPRRDGLRMIWQQRDAAVFTTLR